MLECLLDYTIDKCTVVNGIMALLAVLFDGFTVVMFGWRYF